MTLRGAWAALAVFVLFGGCLARPEPTTGPVVSPTAPTASAPASAGPPFASVGPSAVVTPAAIDPALDWQLVPLGDRPVAATLTDVVAVPDGFLAAGAGGRAGELPVILHSTDGFAWDREGITSRQGMAPVRLALIGNRVVAVGGGQTDRCGHPSALDTWAREVSGTWQEAVFDPAFCVGQGNANLLAGRGGTVVLLGAGSGDVVYLMTSDSGLQWASVPNPFGGLYPQGAVSDGTRIWVFGAGPLDCRACVASGDSETFAPPQDLGLGPDAAIVGAALFDGRPLAIAVRGQAVGLVRLGTDGAWEVTEVAGLDGTAVARIEAVDGHLVALGGDETGAALAWVSADGSSWRPMTLPGAQIGTTLMGAAAHDGIAVIVGQVTDGDGGIAAVWTGSAALLAP
ncbi:MAG: hypothetical protein H0V73_08455 [Chloroflexi bacterium]|nr:hypothetical protein [Chloroflexota bacterium]